MEEVRNLISFKLNIQSYTVGVAKAFDHPIQPHFFSFSSVFFYFVFSFSIPGFRSTHMCVPIIPMTALATISLFWLKKNSNFTWVLLYYMHFLYLISEFKENVSLKSNDVFYMYMIKFWRACLKTWEVELATLARSLRTKWRVL